jgi:hypothetical protein
MRAARSTRRAGTGSRGKTYVMTVDDLVQQIAETERLIVVYRNASEVVVGTQDQIYSRRGLINRSIFTATEIGDHIVNILERRLLTMRGQLEELNVKKRSKTNSRSAGQ